MSAQRNNNEQGTELVPLYIVVALAIIGMLLYFFFHRQIIHAVLAFKYFELSILAIFNQHYHQLMIWIDYANTTKVSAVDLYYLAQSVGQGLRWPSILIIAGLGVLLYYKHPKRFFVDKYNMHSLLKLLLPVFPYAKLTQCTQLVKQPLDKGSWAMGLSPKAFIKKHKLITSTDGSKGKFDVEKAKTLMQGMLGNKWKGVEQLIPVRRIVFACLCAYVIGERQKAEAMLKEIASEIDIQKEKNEVLQLKMIDKVIARSVHHEKVQEIIKAHAYENTIFTTLLLSARQTGIVATSSFLWLKAFDRELWYTLNNVGRQAVFTEGAAVRAHWLIECQAKTAVHIPMIDSAVEALKLYYEQYLDVKDF
ncbi:type IVB secretion system coupling complex protein DotM/IcmP [Facilibium subflavum]|uniref:type IVB secretion system coupling complex protein DotM/IcmP n=1 Tax=Facilibium subflavum TaxID=2219058 RepID=UPI000E65846B|nr:type IVB secretion system coupling complex protein DotM/IcmP [Facilibium subflavum]